MKGTSYVSRTNRIESQRKNSVHSAIPRGIRQENKTPESIKSHRDAKDIIHSQTLQNSTISYDKSTMSIHKFFKNKEELNNYMLSRKYSSSKSHYNKVIDNLSELEKKIKYNNETIEKLKNLLIKLKEKKKQKQLDIVNLLSNKESLEEIYKSKIYHLRNKSQIFNTKDINGQINGNQNINEKDNKQTDEKNKNIDNINNNKIINDSEYYPNLTINLDEENNIEIKIDDLKYSDKKKYEQQVILFTEDILDKKDEELRNILKEKIKLAYQIFSSESTSTSIIEPMVVISNFFLRISLFISNQSLGNYSEPFISSFLRHLLKINSIGVEISKILKFLNKKYKEMKIDIKDKISDINKRNENLKNKKLSYETKKEELERFINDYKQGPKSTDKNRVNSENDNSQIISFISDNNNNNNTTKSKIMGFKSSDKVTNIKKEKIKSSRIKIPKLNNHNKTKMDNLKDEFNNKQINLLKKEKSMDSGNNIYKNDINNNENNNKDKINNNINTINNGITNNDANNNDKKMLIHRINNFKEGLNIKKQIEIENIRNNNQGNSKTTREINKRNNNQRKNSNNKIIKCISPNSNSNSNDLIKNNNKTEINENHNNNTKHEIKIIKAKNINVNRILNINNYQINNTWNDNNNSYNNKTYTRIENKKKNNNNSNDKTINTTNNPIINHLNNYIISNITNKEEKNNIIQQKNNNNKISLNNLLINNNISIGNNNSNTISNTSNNTTIESTKKNNLFYSKKKVDNANNNTSLIISENKRITHKTINFSKNKFSSNNVINTTNNDTKQNTNTEGNALNKKINTYVRNGVNNTIIEIKHIKGNNSTVNNQKITVTKRINDEKNDKSINNQNQKNSSNLNVLNVSNISKKNNINNIIYLKDSKCSSSKNMNNGIKIKISNSPIKLQKKNKVFSPNENVKTEIIFNNRNNFKNNSFFKIVKSPKRNNKINVNNINNNNNNNNVTYISQKSPKELNETFSLRKRHLESNTRYNNHTHNSNIVEILNKKIDIPIIEHYNIYSKRNDNHLKVLTQGIRESFCYFKISDKVFNNNNNFNPLKNSSLKPENFGYIEARISIDIDTHIFKIIPKTSKEKNKYVEDLLNKDLNFSRLHSSDDVSDKKKSYISIELKDIVDVILSNEMKNISKIHEAYLKFRRGKENVNIDNFIHTREISSIVMEKNEKIKAAFCNFFIFSVIFGKKSIPKIDFIFNNYDQFNLWNNCLQYIIKINSQSKLSINSRTYNGN